MNIFFKLKNINVFLVLFILVVVMSGCGKKETASSTGSNIVLKPSNVDANKDNSENNSTLNNSEKTNESQTTNSSEDKIEQKYDVVLDERTDETKYQYDFDDLSLVDTVTGKKITIGMNMSEIEEITGDAISVDSKNRVYDGVIVLFNEENVAQSLIVSAGIFTSKEQSSRYKTSRGVGLSSSFDDFVKAYGDQFNQKQIDETSPDETAPEETPANAIRYFKVSGKKVEYLGDALTDEIKADGIENIYMQDFMFNREKNTVATMRISKIQ